jgi:hypothetical protein
MSLRRALWLIPLAIAAHNAEEYPKMVEYAERQGWRTWSGPAGRRRWRIAILAEASRWVFGEVSGRLDSK